MELDDEELEAVAGGGRSYGADDWNYFIYVVYVNASCLSGDYKKAVELTAKEYNIETSQLYDNIKWFKDMGITTYRGINIKSVYEGLGL